MKINSFYLNDISQYDDIISYLNQEIGDKYYGVGKNSITISRFVDFLKRIIKNYVRIKFKKNMKIILTIPTTDEKVIQHDILNDDIIKIRLSSEYINNVLEGKDFDYQTYVETLVEQLETELTASNKFSFIEYLVTQIDSLADVAMSELESSYTEEFLKHNIIKKESWIKLAQHSSIFKDYYEAYMNSLDNKKLFYSFLKKLATKL